MHACPNLEQFTTPTNLTFMLKTSGKKATLVYLKKNDEMGNKIQLTLEQ